jgi:PAS domain S-box-containing protein
MSSQNSKTFTQSLESVQRRSEDLYQAAHSGYSQMPLMLADYLRELRSALEELQLAEEELKQQNLSLQAERLHYQDLFEFAPDGYLITDIQGTIQEVNQAATVLFRISAQGFPLIQFISEEDRASFRSVLEQLPMINRVQEWEILLRRETGERFKAALTVETVRQEGTAIALRWLIRDITLRKEIEAIQLQNLQLVEFERITNQFMATISHELRTPMNAISGFSQLLLSRVEHFDDPQLALMVERIARNSQCLLRLIEELLEAIGVTDCFF